MIRALLADRKTMTRRLAWRWPKSYGDSRPIVGTIETHGEATSWQRVNPGDRLWVRENFRNQETRRIFSGDGARRLVCIDYDADDSRTHWNLPEIDCPKILLERGAGPSGEQTALLPCLYMPRIVSRLTLTVTATKIERLQEITHEEAEAEGIKCDMSVLGFRDHFAALWDRLHGDGAWAADPEVVALTFDIRKGNIEAPPARTEALTDRLLGK